MLRDFGGSRYATSNSRGLGLGSVCFRNFGGGKVVHVRLKDLGFGVVSASG